MDYKQYAHCLQQRDEDPYKRSRSCDPVIGSDFTILGGTSNPDLVAAVAKRLGRPLAQGSLKQFADGELAVSFDAKDINKKHCYIVQPTCRPVNDSLMQLVFMVSACKRSGAASVTVVMPYFGYARQDRRFGNKAVPISSADVAQMLEHVGVDRIVTVDLHALQCQGMVSSNVVFDNYEAGFAGLSYFINNVQDVDNICVVSPDAGGMHRAKAFQESFKYFGYHKVGLAMISKERKVANQIDSMVLIGDVRGRTCVIVDDMIDTAGTLCTAADLLKNEGGAKDVYAFATHGLFSGAAGDKIATSSLSKVITTDSVLIDPSFRAKVGAKFEQVSLDLLLAEAIRRTHQQEDTSVLLTVPVY